MRWNSFRVRLTLWNIAILALVLSGFGLGFCYSNQNRMSQGIDQDLVEQAHRAEQFVRRHRHRHDESRDPRGPRGSEHGSFQRDERPRGPAPSDERRGAPDRSPHATSPPGPSAAHPPGPSVATAQPGWPRDPDAERRASFQIPRLFDREGHPFGGPHPDRPWDPQPLPGALAGHARYSTAIVAGDRVRLFTAPLYDVDGRLWGAVQAASDLRDLDRQWHRQVGLLLALLPLALLVAAVGGLFLTDRALRPVQQVTQAAAQIGAEDLSRRLKVSGRDELAELATTFNGMIARLEAAFEQQRRFTADASHELRTPLARIKVSTSMALADEPSLEDYRTALQISDQAADVMERLTEQLLFLAGADAGQLPLERARLDLRAILQEAAGAVARAASTPLILDLPPEPIEIDGDADHLGRVFVNLLQNALRHTPAGGRITLWARVMGDEAVVKVEDTGEGIPAEHLPHLGERFYRVDEARARRSGGCGLGIAISRTIVQAHGGCLTIASEVGRGTVVTVSLPRSP
jgi:two-component system, OmpR family, sensor kinase